MNPSPRTRAAALFAAVTLVLGLAALAVVPARADVGVGGFMTSNVTWLGNIPIDGAGGIGARVVEVEGQQRLYVTSIHGLSIYDLSINPALPVLMGHLPLPHWENEDVAVSADGNTVLVTHDRLVSSSAPLIVIDTTIPQAPVIAATMSRSAHTVTCADDACDWVYSSEGEIYDLRDKSAPAIHSSWYAAVADQGVTLRQGAHDLNRDDAGYLTTDTVPRVMLDVTDPTDPQVVTTSTDEQSAGRIAYQHNNQRPNASLWSPRDAGDDGGLLRPGELVLSNGETNFAPFCNGTTNGPFATWDARNWDQGEPMRPIEVFRPVASNLNDGDNQPYIDGNPYLNAVGCSGHWFDWSDDVVAASWYEHGTRFLGVDPATGDVEEVGFFQPVTGSAFASHWVTDEIVYTIDLVRGIDVLRFDRDGDAPTIDELLASWQAAADPASATLSEAERLYCQLGVSKLDES